MGRLLTKDELEIVSGGEDEIIVTGTQTGSGDTSSGGTFIGGGAPGSPGDVISIHQDAPPDENEEQMDEIIVNGQTNTPLLDGWAITLPGFGLGLVTTQFSFGSHWSGGDQEAEGDIDSENIEAAEDHILELLLNEGLNPNADWNIEYDNGVFYYWAPAS